MVNNEGPGLGGSCGDGLVCVSQRLGASLDCFLTLMSGQCTYNLQWEVYILIGCACFLCLVCGAKIASIFCSKIMFCKRQDDEPMKGLQAALLLRIPLENGESLNDEFVMPPTTNAQHLLISV